MEALPNQMQIARLAAGGCFSRALALAARLGIADIVNDGHLHFHDIAEHTGSDPDVMRRLLQVLAIGGVVERDQDGAFAMTGPFTALRSDHPRSMRNFSILMAEIYDDAFGGLSHTVRTGDSGFRQVFGVPLYAYLERDAETARIFDGAMSELTRPVAAALAERHDFSSAHTVVDVGGGDGTLLAGILAEHPHLTGVCVDRPSVCERAATALRTSVDHQVARRIALRPADIFEDVPEGGDRYLLKNVLHDWSPETCGRLLTSIGRAMRRTTEGRDPGVAAPRLLVLESLLDQDSDAPHVLFQMVMCGKDTGGYGEGDLRLILRRSGFTPVLVERLAGGHHLFECVQDLDRHS
ncbi:methyltransferase [Streptomyces sp. SP18CS02]|uniref:methyltransferase n=1 Tax=Streptomyces sp. SP18CS02 TaxID=3002531 RepID=UPI002E78B7DF|nr:methyltransferase [Streptomyces sp. SP18CS02]MEE1751925.1 methyltransferase [Streptomyces sp. SP18CS02]